MKKKLIGSALILMLLTLCVSCGNKGNKAIKIVQSGTFPTYGKLSVKEGADLLLERADYSAYEFGDGVYIVNIDGYLDIDNLRKRMLKTKTIKHYLDEEEAEEVVDQFLSIFGYEPYLTYQMLVDLSDKSFICSNVMFNGEESNEADIELFLKLLVQNSETFMKYILE